SPPGAPPITGGASPSRGSDLLRRGQAPGLGADRLGETRDCRFEGRAAAGAELDARLPPDLADLQPTLVAAELGVGPADQAVAFEDGEDVVAVDAPRARHEGLEAVVEAEEALGAAAVAEDGIEGGEEAQARRWLGRPRRALFPIRDGAGELRPRAVHGGDEDGGDLA